MTKLFTDFFIYAWIISTLRKYGPIKILCLDLLRRGLALGSGTDVKSQATLRQYLTPVRGEFVSEGTDPSARRERSGRRVLFPKINNLSRFWVGLSLGLQNQKSLGK